MYFQKHLTSHKTTGSLTGSLALSTNLKIFLKNEMVKYQGHNILPIVIELSGAPLRVQVTTVLLGRQATREPWK